MGSGAVQTLILVLVFASAFLALQTLIGLGKQATRRVAFANHRLRRLDSDTPHTEVIARLLKSRGLDENGQLSDIMQGLNRLVVHSGLRVGAWAVYPAMLLSALGLSGLVHLWRGQAVITVMALVAGFALPVFVLRFLVKRRRAKAVAQLPNALDVIIRSLAAGHPVPVAMKLVGRELPDPIGTEFGIASDEVAFGSDTAGAIQRMSERIGHEDFDLFAAMIRLQERTGGNLADLLRSSAKTIRDRQTMRLRIKAASAEGRMSALILNAAPIAMYLLISVGSPDFYGELRGHPTLTKAFWGVSIWMVIGNLVMRKMINFKI